jgi:predicted transcriptional regulator
VDEGIDVSAEEATAAADAAPTHDLEADVDTVIAVCGGDPRVAVRTLLIANEFLSAELDSATAALSRGYTRGRI